MTAYSRALASFDRGDYANAMQTMQPVMQAAPNSMLVKLTYDEMKRRATTKATDKARDQIKQGLPGIFKSPE